MAFYRENDGNILKEYALDGGCESLRTDKAVVDIVPTKAFDEMVFIDGQLQFSRKDEYIYHEMLVHPAMSSQVNPSDVCILGGGDGYAVREVLKWNTVRSIDLFDYDKDIVNIFKHQYASWNSGSLSSSKLHIHIQDVRDIPTAKQYDVVIVDLLDPNYLDAESKSIWTTLCLKLPSLLKETSSLVINAGKVVPWEANSMEWLLFQLTNYFRNNTTHTLEAYKVYVPSFGGEWCFLFVRPIESSLRLSQFIENHYVRYFDEKAWFLASTWTKDNSNRIPSERVKLNGYLPPL